MLIRDLFTGEEDEDQSEKINTLKKNLTKSSSNIITIDNNISNYGTLYSKSNNKFNDSNKSRGSNKESSNNNFYSPINYKFNYTNKSESPKGKYSLNNRNINAGKLRELPDIQAFVKNKTNFIPKSKSPLI